mmetsp:Transcript_12897/g.24910  ORF Transcript_12897/g.24910 Transcript_12897/m.24910 type:complete len:266 (-) Transcript_12897:387-1184(-)
MERPLPDTLEHSQHRRAVAAAAAAAAAAWGAGPDGQEIEPATCPLSSVRLRLCSRAQARVVSPAQGLRFGHGDLATTRSSRPNHRGTTHTRCICLPAELFTAGPALSCGGGSSRGWSSSRGRYSCCRSYHDGRSGPCSSSYLPRGSASDEDWSVLAKELGGWWQSVWADYRCAGWSCRRYRGGRRGVWQNHQAQHGCSFPSFAVVYKDLNFARNASSSWKRLHILLSWYTTEHACEHIHTQPGAGRQARLEVHHFIAVWLLNRGA